ncbi:hypothetical protein KR009_007700 [Drosophila setifemur]|nr:hypothetical protein KR009_007700 [Drosophila setifemur]
MTRYNLKICNCLALYAGQRTCSILSSKVPLGNIKIRRTTKTFLETPMVYEQERCLHSVIQVEHDDSRFFINISGQEAELSYNVHEGVMNIIHTKVPKELSGKGLGKVLAKAALNFALLNGYFLVIKCHFVEAYIDKYEPRYSKYIIK